jgi:hypothetical protein
MSVEKPTSQELDEAIRQLKEGVGEANRTLADVTEYLDTATRDLHLPPAGTEQPPIPVATPAAERESPPT